MALDRLEGQAGYLSLNECKELLADTLEAINTIRVSSASRFVPSELHLQDVHIDTYKEVLDDHVYRHKRSGKSIVMRYPSKNGIPVIVRSENVSSVQSTQQTTSVTGLVIDEIFSRIDGEIIQISALQLTDHESKLVRSLKDVVTEVLEESHDFFKVNCLGKKLQIRKSSTLMK